MKRITTTAAFVAATLLTTAAHAQRISDACEDRAQCGDDMVCLEGNCLDDGKLLVTLSWAANADLDISLRTPTGAVIAAGLNDTIMADGGELRRDECYREEECQDDSGHLNVEHIVWEWRGGQMPEGQFEAWATNFDGRNGADYTLTIGKPDGSSETFSGGVEGAKGAESEHHVFTVEDTICEEDSDKDGICDKWELEGVDIDEDGEIDLDLPGKGADPKHKDLFVEVDWFKDQQVFGLGAVASAYSTAPVDNPDGKPGITLHIERDEEIDSYAGSAVTGASFFNHNDIGYVKYGTADESDDSNSCTSGWFGTKAEREADNCPAIMKARKQVYRYAVFVSRLTIGGYSGVGELAGNDFVVSVGSWGKENTQAVQQGTFMHELGHTLGLGHGGGDHHNCKPNHLSVMNYMYQFPTNYAGRPLTYGPKLPMLDESALHEADGLGGPAGWTQVAFNLGADLITTKTDASQPVDWNQDEDTDDDVTESVSSGSWACGGKGAATTLESVDEWKRLRLNFRTTGGWNAIFPGADFGEGEDGSGASELDKDAYDQMARGSDSDDDGFSNLDDNCAAEPNPGQEDGDADGVGDVCDSCPEVAAVGYVDGCPESASPDAAAQDTSARNDAPNPDDRFKKPEDPRDKRIEDPDMLVADAGCSTTDASADGGAWLLFVGLFAFRRRRTGARRRRGA